MKSRMKRFSTLLPAFLCILAFLLAACSNDGTVFSPEPNPRSSQVLILPEAGVSDIATFDPALSTDMPSMKAITMVYTALVGLDDNGHVTGNLVTSWDISADHLTYTFHLRPNLKFGDGRLLNATDVAYSIDRALQPTTKSRTAPYYLRYIKDATLLASGKIKTIIGDSIQIPDDNTVVIKAAAPVSFFLDTLTAPCAFVVEKSLIDAYGNAHFTDHLYQGGGGDGPFKVQAYTHDRQIVFIPNPNYYGPIPQLQKVIFPFYKDADTTYNAYLLNQLDEAPVPVEDYSTAKVRADFHAVPLLETNYYAMNYAIKPFDNIAIRQAFELAINKDLVVQAAWKNSLISTNHIVPEGMQGYNPSLTEVDGTLTQGDQMKAKTLFAEGMRQEGWTNISQVPPVTLTYASSGNQTVKNEVSIVQQEWQDVLGVRVKVDDIDLHTLQTAIVSNHLQFWRSTWVADYSDPEDWTTLQFGPGSSNNNMNYGQNHSSDAAAQQQVQKQLEAADMNPNPVTRLQAYNTAEQSLVNDVAWLPMEQVTGAYLVKPCVYGFFVDVDRQGLIAPNNWGGTYITVANPCATT